MNESHKLVLSMAIALAAVAPALAQSEAETSARLEALFGAHEPYEAFLATLKDAVSAKDKRSVAAMIAYPLGTRIAGEEVMLGSEDDLVRRYDQLFTPPVLAAALGQTYATLFATADGVMIGDGEIWFSGICADETCSEVSVKIIAVNPPDEAPGHPAGKDPRKD
jgi:hypothetical protein